MTIEYPRSIRRMLPRFRRDEHRVARVANMAREKVPGRLPALMEDTRINYLAQLKGIEKGEYIFVKAVASPWTGEHGIHLMVIPDREDYQNIPGICDLTPAALGLSLLLAESLAYSMLQQEGIVEVDFGINHSRAESKKIDNVRKSPLASIPHNLHIHVTGYSAEDMEPLNIQDIIASSDITGRTAEAVYVLGEQLLFGEVIPELRNNFSAFDEIFSEIKDQRGRRRFMMKAGRQSFQHPDLPGILQAMDVMAKQKYDELAKCFFEFDGDSNQFVTRQDSSERYKLLPENIRVQRINGYNRIHPNLSNAVTIGLNLLASMAKEEQFILQRELEVAERRAGRSLSDEAKEIAATRTANRFWAYKDLAYALVWSAKKEADGDIIWIFGFDPKVFTIHGPHQSSAYTTKLVERDISRYLTASQLQLIQQRENAVLARTKEELPGLELRI